MSMSKLNDMIERAFLGFDFLVKITPPSLATFYPVYLIIADAPRFPEEIRVVSKAPRPPRRRLRRGDGAVLNLSGAVRDGFAEKI